MSTPAQMFDHELNALKGWPSPYAVDKVANLYSGDAVIAGQVMSLEVGGSFRPGLAVDSVGIFALQNSTDFDVVSDDGGMVGGPGGVARMSGLVALGAYELESTEFDSSKTYNPNALLTSPVPGAANAGRLTLGTKWTDTVCGVVSDGVVTNCSAVDVLRFWPTWLPTR